MNDKTQPDLKSIEEVEQYIKNIKKTINDTEKYYQCKICKEKITRQDKFTNHVKFKHFADLYKYKCEVCEIICGNKGALTKHNNDNHKQEKIDELNKIKQSIMENQKANNNSIKKVNAIKEIKSIDVTNITELEVINSIKKGTGAKECPLCNVKLDNRYECIIHIKKTHYKNDMQLFTCDIDNCNQEFMFPCELVDHKKEYHDVITEIANNKEMICQPPIKDINHIYFETIETITVGKKYIYKCKICSNIVKYTRETCITHIKGHYFKNKSEAEKERERLIDSITSSSNADIFHCSVPECNARFKSRDACIVHIDKVHFTDNFKYECTECDKKFQFEYLLTKHISSKHNATKKENIYVSKDELDDFTRLIDSVNCPLCDFKSASIKNCKTHINTHLARDLPVNSQGIVVRKIAILKQINNRIFRNKNFECIICNRSFSAKQTLEKHVDTHYVKTIDENITIKDIDDEPPTISKDEALNNRKIVDGKFKCLVCEEKNKEMLLSNIDSLRAHLKLHYDEKKYKCEKCNKSWHHQYELNNHNDSIHNISKPKKESNTCEYAKSLIIIARKINAGDNGRFLCPDKACTKDFKNRKQVYTHIRILHNASAIEYRCRELIYKDDDNNDNGDNGDNNSSNNINGGNGSNNNYNNSDGNNNNNGDNGNSDNNEDEDDKDGYEEEDDDRICDKVYKYKSDLIRHQRGFVHTGIKEQCPFEQCDREFYNNGELVEHIKSCKYNIDKIVIECDICYQTFSRTPSLTLHKKLFHNPNAKKFHCTVNDCKSYRNIIPFRTYGELKRHINELHIREIHECDECYSIYISNDSLRLHKKNKHNSKILRLFCRIKKCPIGEKSNRKLCFNSKSSLNTHHREYHNKKIDMLKCDNNKCNSEFYNRHELKIHKRDNHGMIYNFDTCMLCLTITEYVRDYDNNGTNIIVCMSCIKDSLYTKIETKFIKYLNNIKYLANFDSGANIALSSLGGCSLVRPDKLYIDKDLILWLECDENQHNDYDPLCEEARITKAYDNNFIGQKLIVIRWNPHSYKTKDGRRKSIDNRLDMLEILIREILGSSPPEDLIYIYYMYYDYNSKMFPQTIPYELIQ